MKSKEQIEELRDILGAMVEISNKDKGPFNPTMISTIAGIWNCLCYILEDGSPHAETFEKNFSKLMQWCDANGIKFIKVDPEQKVI